MTDWSVVELSVISFIDGTNAIIECAQCAEVECVFDTHCHACDERAIVRRVCADHEDFCVIHCKYCNEYTCDNCSERCDLCSNRECRACWDNSIVETDTGSGNVHNNCARYCGTLDCDFAYCSGDENDESYGIRECMQCDALVCPEHNVYCLFCEAVRCQECDECPNYCDKVCKIATHLAPQQTIMPLMRSVDKFKLRLAKPDVWVDKYRERYFVSALAMAPLDLPVLVSLMILDETAPPVVADYMNIHLKWELLRLVKNLWLKKNE